MILNRLYAKRVFVIVAHKAYWDLLPAFFFVSTNVHLNKIRITHYIMGEDEKNMNGTYLTIRAYHRIPGRERNDGVWLRSQSQTNDLYLAKEEVEFTCLGLSVQQLPKKVTREIFALYHCLFKIQYYYRLSFPTSSCGSIKMEVQLPCQAFCGKSEVNYLCRFFELLNSNFMLQRETQHHSMICSWLKPRNLTQVFCSLQNRTNPCTLPYNLGYLRDFYYKEVKSDSRPRPLPPLVPFQTSSCGPASKNKDLKYNSKSQTFPSWTIPELSESLSPCTTSTLNSLPASNEPKRTGDQQNTPAISPSFGYSLPDCRSSSSSNTSSTTITNSPSASCTNTTPITTDGFEFNFFESSEPNQMFFPSKSCLGCPECRY